MPGNKKVKVNHYAEFLDTLEGTYFIKYNFIKYVQLYSRKYANSAFTSKSEVKLGNINKRSSL